MASDEPPPPQLTGLGKPTAGRSPATMLVTGGAGNDEEGMAEPPLGDFVLIAGPRGLELDPIPLSIVKQGKEVSASSLHLEKHCVQCGATETPRWRFQPVGLGALCNACRIWLRPGEALLEPVHVHRHLPPPATPATFISWLAEKSPSPASAPATAPEEKKKQKRTRKQPLSRGVRYKKQGRLLQEQEYRPAASPNFKPSEHACKLRGKELHQPPQPAAMQMQPRSGGELPTAGKPIPLDQVLPHAIDGELQMADPSSLDDEFLFNGPAAPMLIDDEEALAD